MDNEGTCYIAKKKLRIFVNLDIRLIKQRCMSIWQDAACVHYGASRIVLVGVVLPCNNGGATLLRGLPRGSLLPFNGKTQDNAWKRGGDRSSQQRTF